MRLLKIRDKIKKSGDWKCFGLLNRYMSTKLNRLTLIISTEMPTGLYQRITPEFINPVIIYPLSFFTTIIFKWIPWNNKTSMTGCNLEVSFELLGLHSHAMQRKKNFPFGRNVVRLARNWFYLCLQSHYPIIWFSTRVYCIEHIYWFSLWVTLLL